MQALAVDWRAGFAAQTTRYFQGVERAFSVQIERIALDAPGIPCPAHVNRREAERALDARRISCFTTPSETQFEEIQKKALIHLEAGGPENRLPHANQIWMLVGFALFRQLEFTWPCLEVYPQATVALLGSGGLHKSKNAGLAAQLGAVGQHLEWDAKEFEAALRRSGFGQLHDQFDAYLAAWVASLKEGEREPLGLPPEDVIWVPRL